jgi:hypothetical protein
LGDEALAQERLRHPYLEAWFELFYEELSNFRQPIQNDFTLIVGFGKLAWNMENITHGGDHL